MVLVLGIVKASLEILGIGIGVKKVVLIMSVVHHDQLLLSGGGCTKATQGYPECTLLDIHIHLSVCPDYWSYPNLKSIED